MVKRGARPAWHLVATGGLLVVAAAAIFLLHWRSRPDPAAAGSDQRLPTRPAAFADSLNNGVEDALAEVGVWLELIDIERSSGRSGHRIEARVPADLPLPVANIALTGLVRRLEGRVLRGAETAGKVVLFCGPSEPLRGLTRPDSTWPAGATSRVELRRDAGLRRRTGRIAVILDSLDGLMTDPGGRRRLLELSPLTLRLAAEQAGRSRMAEPLVEAGHQILVGDARTGGVPTGALLDSSHGAGHLVIDAREGREAAEDQLWELAYLAADRGSAVGVGRGRESTLQALEAVLPRLETRGYRLVTISGLAR